MKTIETKLEEFEAQYQSGSVQSSERQMDWAQNVMPQIKDFIRQALTEQLTELKEKIEEIRKQSGSEWAPERVAGKTAYNQALFDILTLIDSMK